MRRAVAIALALALALPGAAAAQCPRTSLGDIEDEVMCPVCGTPLALATEAPQARRQRAYIERLIDDCRSKEEIKAALTEQYGPTVLALPPADRGLNAAAYAVPAAVVVGGLAGVGFAALRWRRRRTGPPTPGAPASPAPQGGDTARLEADLERYDL